MWVAAILLEAAFLAGVISGKQAWVPSNKVSSHRHLLALVSRLFMFALPTTTHFEGTKWNPTIPTWPLVLEKHGYFLGYSYEGETGKTKARLGGARIILLLFYYYLLFFYYLF